MLLKNTKARLITIRDTELVSYRILPGNNPSVEVPNRLCEQAFAKALIGTGELRVECEDDALEPVIDVDAEPSVYDGMNKADLISLCDSREIEVSSRDTVKSLTGKLEAHDAE